MKPVKLLDEAIEWMEMLDYRAYEKALVKIRQARDLLRREDERDGGELGLPDNPT